MESTSSDPDTSTDDLQRSIDQEIETNLEKIAGLLESVEKCRESVRALRTKRNQTVPISDLPPEIVCKIFLFLRFDEEYEWRRWIYLAHVTRHWRDVVFAFPALWNHSPPLALHHWVDEILRRSPEKVAGFSLSADMDCGQSIQGLKRILRHSSEIKSLSITNMQYRHQGIMERLRKFAPHLQALCIAGPPGSGAQDMRHYIDQFRIPDNVLIAAAKLRRLELSDCRVYFNSYILFGITHLKLHDLSRYERPTYSEFMNALGKIINLQHLDLKKAFPFDKSPQDEHSPPDHVTFSHLQSLTMSCTVTQAQDFFCGITFPSSAKVNISLKRLDGSSLMPVLSSIADARNSCVACSPYADSCKIRTIVVGDGGLRFMLLTNTYDGPEDASTMCGNAADVLLLLECNGRVPNALPVHIANQTLSDFFSSGFPLKEVSHVLLDAPDIEAETLVDTIGVLPAVSFIKVTGPMAKPFIDALHPLRFRHILLNGGLHFPNLQSICIGDIEFDSPFAGYLSISIETLRACLVQRREHGGPIRKMVLLDCENLTEEDVANLRDIVADVEWDGIDEDWATGSEDSFGESDYSTSHDSEGDNGYHSSTDSDDLELSTSESNLAAELDILTM